jgi:hypothetical protein
MKYRKFNRYEQKEVRAQQIENAIHGEGIYLYRNNTNADLTLPRPTKSGLRSVGPGKEFQGDNYYMQLVKTGFCRLVKEIQSPQQALAEANMQQDKLILDQPDMITEQGKVEHVVKNAPVKKINEQDKKDEESILLNEASSGEGFVIVN